MTPRSATPEKTTGELDVKRSMPSVQEYATEIMAGSRRHVAKAITWCESTRREHQEWTRELLTALAPPKKLALRVGISGVPGAGKSTFINNLGLRLVEAGHRVAVLAVDPSSTRTGGSILGDRTRMAELAASDRAYIRPSPTAGYLGGVARATRESMALVEAGGFDVVIVETVGVGQSEVAVADMVDTYLLLALARSGDSLQGIKRGVLELADVVAINKCDGEHVLAGKAAAAELTGALRLLRSGDGEPLPVVTTCSSTTGMGVDEVWRAVEARHMELVETGRLRKRRAAQRQRWLWALAEAQVLFRFEENTAVQTVADKELDAVMDGTESVSAVAERMVAAFLDED